MVYVACVKCEAPVPVGVICPRCGAKQPEPHEIRVQNRSIVLVIALSVVVVVLYSVLHQYLR
ncbi:hypothetical protein RvVAR0630_13320 [Agrobacterium vitis]|nr:hypothetical protein RvVAR0630_13320 [Agrobacterium vitis]